MNAVEDVERCAQENQKPAVESRYSVKIGDEKFSFQPYEIDNAFPNGLELLEIAGRIPAENFALLQIFGDGRMEVLGLDQKADLCSSGIEKFLALPTDRLFFLDVNGKRLEWSTSLISGRTVKLLAGADIEDGLTLKMHDGNPREIGDKELVDLSTPGIEHFVTFKRNRKVTVTIDSKSKEIDAGKYVVSSLKTILGVPADKELEQVFDGVLTPLADSSSITIVGCEVFISHTRRGGSA